MTNIVLQVGVKTLLKNKKGKFLLLKRNSNKYKNIVGNWDIVGGRINPGTHLLENLKREVKEETGLDLVDEPVLIAAQDIMPSDTHHVVRLTFIGNIDGEPNLDLEESTEYQWFSLEELKSLEDLDQYLKKILDKIVSYAS